MGKPTVKSVGKSVGKPVGKPVGPRPSGTRPGSSRTGSGPRGGPGRQRPALAARPRTTAPVPPSPSTTWVRAGILAAIVVMLAVTLVPTLRSLIAQRNDTAVLAAKVVDQQADVAALERQAALWKDPAYIEVQARERLKFVRVGDRAYTVLAPPSEAAKTPGAVAPVVAAPLADDASPWYGKVWQSIQIADRPTAGLPSDQ
ncbi:MAG: septum formation initiator family protein [Terracoccus sp.]